MSKDRTKDTSPQTPRAKRIADSDPQELAPTIPPDAAYRVPDVGDPDGLAQQLVQFMNRAEHRFLVGEQRMEKIEGLIGDVSRVAEQRADEGVRGLAALIKEVRTHLTTRERFMMTCTAVAAFGTAISAAILTMFFLMRIFGVPDLSHVLDHSAQAQQQHRSE